MKRIDKDSSLVELFYFKFIRSIRLITPFLVWPLIIGNSNSPKILLESLTIK